MPATAPQVQARPPNPQSLKFAPPAQPKVVPQRAAPPVPPQALPPEAAQPARRWVLPRATPPAVPAPPVTPAAVPADVFAREPSNPFALDSDAMVMIESPAAAAEAKAPSPTEAEKDPFEDLEAEMASLLGRGAPR
ncbi:hypothetical protein V5F77_11940 [Xanthobacter sp. DSM 24535]|uniref:hypothetical protein n=1 Tax=Roseixanthobacter psychrophilus TaxID=3119917 RepID=UPI00372BF2AA